MNRGEPRQQIVARYGAHHGGTFGGIDVGERSLFSEPFDAKLFPVASCPWPARLLFADSYARKAIR